MRTTRTCETNTENATLDPSLALPTVSLKTSQDYLSTLGQVASCVCLPKSGKFST